MPKCFKKLQIEDFIKRNQSWIDKAVATIANEQSKLNKELDSHHSEILLFGEWIKKDEFCKQYNVLDSKNLAKALRQILLDYILPRTQELAKAMNLAYQSIRISNATSCFGSCSHSNKLAFSLMLIFAKKSLIDYVIVHELAHIVHKNHSPHFWHLVESNYPQCKDARQILRQNARIFPLLLKQL